MSSPTVRLDKFLWSVRLFKTRSLAAEACESGRVRVSDIHVKPSRTVREGDILTVRRPDMMVSYRVVALCDKRLSAPLVKDYLCDITPAEELEKAAMMKLQSRLERDRGTGRPTKKERRTLDQFFDEETE